MTKEVLLKLEDLYELRDVLNDLEGYIKKAKVDVENIAHRVERNMITRDNR